MWADISQEDLGIYRSNWQQYADHRYALQLRNEDGLPAVNVPLQLVDGQGSVLWRARTDALGRAELWAHYFRQVSVAANGLRIECKVPNQRFSISAKPFTEGINTHEIKQDCRKKAEVDVAFVVDATGSMGDEIKYLQAELLNVIGRVREELPKANVRTGSVFYRDQGEEYLTRVSPFTADTEKTDKFIGAQYANGGGDYPEAVEVALEAALDELDWRSSASTRLLFLVLDAPPHQAAENIKKLQVAVTRAAARGVQIIPVSCSGVDKNTEYLLRAMALATNGTYTFVTDHSGIGNAHIEPSTDSYDVAFLNDVLVRLTVSRSRLVTCDQPIALDENLPSPFLKTPVSGERNWTFYPNPSAGPVSLRYEEAEGNYYLFDAQGKLLERFTAQTSIERDWSHLASGRYWIRHQNAAGMWTQGQLVLAAR
ncbi:MAG: VWA domain-containing protein, partial [Bacteroidota bacterium]